MDIGTILTFSKEDCQKAFEETTQNLERRLSILTMNAWRINGLISAIGNKINNNEGNAASSLNPEETKTLATVLDYIEGEMSLPNVDEFCKKMKIGLKEGITDYLLELRKPVNNLRATSASRPQMIKRKWGKC